MWSGEGGVDERGGEGRVTPAQPPPDMVSSSTSPSPAAVDLSLKSTTQECSLSEEEDGGEGPAETSDTPTSTSAMQTGLREYSSIKEVLLEMTNRKNGHSKLPPARWGIMKKEAEQVLLKVPKYVVDDKKGAFPRPTAFVNPFPADGIPPNGATLQTSIKDWLNGNKIDLSPRELNKHCTVPKASKLSIRQRLPRSSNGRVMRKRPLTTIVAQLAGNIQNSQSLTNSPPVAQTIMKPISSETVSFLAPHRLSGGEVSITDVSPDVNVIDRLKRLGTVIEVEEQAEKDSLKLLEKMTKSVASDVDVTPVSKTAKHPSKPPNSRQGSKQRSKLQSPQDLTRNSPIQLTVPSEMPIITLINVPSEQSVQLPFEQGQAAKSQSVSHLSITSNHITKAQTPNQAFSIPASQTLSPQATVGSLSTDPSPKVQIKTNQSSKAQSQTAQVKSNNQNSDLNSVQPSSQSLKDLPILISLTPKIQFAQRSKPLNVKMTKPKTPVKPKVLSPSLPVNSQQPPVIPMSSNPLTVPLFISKDVTLIPKPLSETLHDKIEPSLLEPVIDIVEEDNSTLSQDGTFLFRTDSFHNIDLPNDQKVFSCDICSAVYTHSNMMRRHYLRLHISRKYISEKDMETFNIDPEPNPEKCQDNLVFRCHNCRECFASKNDLRSHLTDHPPVDELTKQNNKPHPTYKCENCSAVFKWRKQFGKHKKMCKGAPLTTNEKTDLFHCLYCNETFLNGNAKRNHILSNHPYVRRKHCCVFCKRDGFPTNVSLFSHLLNDHPTVYFACQVCKERFTHLEDLKVHVDERHEQDDKLKSSMTDRVSAVKQDKIYYSCDTCQRKFLIKKSFTEHICFPEKQEKPKLQKIKKKVHSERSEKHSRTVDLETLFFSRVARNVRDNLLHHLDGKIYKEDSSEEGENGNQSSNSSRMCLNFSDGFPSSSEILMDENGADTPTRVKAPWEKYNFPKNYDGRCGLSSYIKDTAYLDISTQLIMRRNLQRLNMLPMRESPSDDVPSAVALERLSAECAESFGSIKKEKIEGGVSEEGPELGSLSGEWVRERMYVCSACSWETPCLWTMEDHKYLAHPRVHCPQHELIGEQAYLSQTLYKRLVNEEPPFKAPMPPPGSPISSLTCTKCDKSNFSNQTELHIHILECAGVVVEAVGPPSKKRRRRSRRRPRRGLKRNIPQTPQKLPPKQRTKPGDTDTIQRMIANLPPKRVSRKVLSSFDENKARLNAQKNKVVKGAKNKKTKEEEKRSQSEPPRTPIKDHHHHHHHHHEKPMILQKPVLIRKEQDYIDTSAEGGDVLSSLRMMPVRAIRVPVVAAIAEPTLIEVKDDPASGQPDDTEMPTLEIEKDISPVESSEIPVLSPVDSSTEKEVRTEKDNLICGISFVDGKITYETVTSVSEETQNLTLTMRKRKSVTSSGPKNKKACKGKKSSLEVENQPVIVKLDDSKEVLSIPNESLKPSKPSDVKSISPKQKGKKTTKSIDKICEDVPFVKDAIPSIDDTIEEILSNVKSSLKLKGKKSIKSHSSVNNISSAELDLSAMDIVELEKQPKKSVSPKQRGKKANKSVDNVENNVIDLIPSVPDILESEKPQAPILTSRQRGKKLGKATNVNSEESIPSGNDAIPFAPGTSETSPILKPTALRRGRKKGAKSLTNVDILSSPVDASMVPDILDTEKSLKPVSKQRRKKSIRTSTGTVNENVSTSDDVIPPILDVLETAKSLPTKARGKKSNKSSVDVVSEEIVSSAADDIPGVLEPEILPISRSFIPKQKGKRSNKVIVDTVLEENVSPVFDIPVVSDTLEPEKLPMPKSSIIKSKGRKSNKISDDSVLEVLSSHVTPTVQDVLESEKLPTAAPSTPKQKGKKPSKPTVTTIIDDIVSSVSDDLIPPVPDTVESNKVSSPKQKGKKGSKLSKELLNVEDITSDTNIQPLGPEEAGKENKISPKLKGKSAIIDLPTDSIVTEADNLDVEKTSLDLRSSEIDALLSKQKGKRPIKQSLQDTESNDLEKTKTDSPKRIIIKKVGLVPEKQEAVVTTRRGPGRPRGSLTRRFVSLETRKSSRKSLNNDLSCVKYDEILPCEEDEVHEIVKKPEKPARKPRTVKEPQSSDSTTIVVEVEIHPEPTLKRKIAEASVTELDGGTSSATKKMRDDIDRVLEIKENDNTVQNIPSQLAVVSQLVDTNSKNSIESIDEESSNKLQPEIDCSDKSTLSPQKEKTDISPKYDKKKLDISLSPSKSVTCYNSPTIEKEVFSNSPKHQTKVIDVYEFVDNDISEDCTKYNNNSSVINIDKDAIVVGNEIKEDVTSSKKDEPLENNINIITTEDTITIEVESNFIDNTTIDIPESISNAIQETIITNEETGVPVKKKKLAKKLNKVKKKIIKSPTICDDNVEEDFIVESSEIEADNSEFLEKLNESEKDKMKKNKKQGKKEICEAQIVDVKKNKKEFTEVLDTKKLKKLVKKKKVIKKMVKTKKRLLNKPQKGSEVVNIGGFTWEVSELEAPQLEESESPPQPDSSVGELELKLDHEELPPPKLELPAPLPISLSSVLLAPLRPVIPAPVSPQPPAQSSNPALTTFMAPPAKIDKPVSTMPPPAKPDKPIASSEPPTVPISSSRQSSALHLASLASTTSVRPSPAPSSSSHRSSTTWESPWGQSPSDTSIGTIIDSVNKLLNDPESAFTPLGLPNYSLADLQKAMGASDDEMAVLQQLGEASLQIAATDESAALKPDSDDWNGEKCIMDLDSHTNLQKEPTVPTSTSTFALPDADVPCDSNSLITEEDWRWREKSPSQPEAGGTAGSSSLLEAHQGKEVLCPSCSCHFMGFPALQKHLVKAHPTVDPASKQKRGAGTPFTKTDLNRIIPMDSSKGPRLICFTCEQILPSDRMGLHLDQEHGIAPEEVTKCANLHGESHEGPVIGERLKSKMSLKLGDLLDRAVNNLLQAKHKPNNTLSGGAVELLARLCAVRKREGSVKHRLHGAREFLSKLQRQQEMKDDEEVKVVKKLFSCSICGLKFSLPSSRNKHEVLAHRSYRPVEREYDEYENDWREAPSPPEVVGENGEHAITPQCSDCGLSFDSIQEMMRHRIEDHTARRPSVDTIVTTGTGCCPSPVPSSGGSRSQPDSESEVAEPDGSSSTTSSAGTLAKPRSNKFRRHGLSRNGSKLVKEKAEAALRELNHLRQRPCGEGRRWPLAKGGKLGNEVYSFTDDSL